jgi:transposase-like protein
MGQVLHRCATTTAAVRRAIQHSQASMRVLAQRHGVNPKTVWKKRESTADRRTGPTAPGSTVLSVEQEAVIVAFRKGICHGRRERTPAPNIDKRHGRGAAPIARRKGHPCSFPRYGSSPSGSPWHGWRRCWPWRQCSRRSGTGCGCWSG